jgi:phenylpropionate dioxygenase-like ring-hydroxylating dioxygenase large terminal subunit
MIDPQGLVQPDRVHRAAYLSPEVFALEQERVFAASWNFVAHASQLPEAGDYVTLDLAGQPLIVMRQPDSSIAVLANRCAHKGTQLLTQACGNAGRLLRCPYHAWTYRLDGSPLGIPLKAEYAGTRLDSCEAGRGLSRVASVSVYRGFVFVRLAGTGPSLQDYFGPALHWLDQMADRSPAGRLEVAGGIIRSTIRCNWKVYLENINDTVHPVSTHESAGKAAKAVWSEHGADADTPPPRDLEQMLPFASGMDYFARMDADIYPNGHSVLGISFSSHSGYGLPEGYREQLVQAHGAERAQQVLERSPQNVVLYPSMAVKSSPLAMRVIRPLAADRTLIEAWSFRAVGAPEDLLHQALAYNRNVFSPMSIIAHDDVHLFECIQHGLQADGNDWISLHRGYEEGEAAREGTVRCRGTNELLMRNQFRAWATMMGDAR